MVSTQSPALSSSQMTDLGVSRRRGLELFCLSFIALFLELMVIRWAPAVVRLIAYYANLILISSFLGLGVGAFYSQDKKLSFRIIARVIATISLQGAIALATDFGFWNKAIPLMRFFHILRRARR